MKLLVDAGNTRLKLSWASAATRTAHHADGIARAAEVAAFSYDALPAASDWVAALPGAVTASVAVYGVSVVDAPRLARVEAALRAGMETRMRTPPRTGRHTPLRFYWLDSTVQAGGVRNGYAFPQQLGADRWAALVGVAAHERLRRTGLENPQAPPVPVLLASFGTATTLDALLPRPATAHTQQGGDVDGGDDACEYVFPGGLIVPGVDLMRQSLSRGTVSLAASAAPLSGQNTPPPSFPTCTQAAIAGGIAAAQAGALWRQWTRLGPYGGDIPSSPRLYVTGGAWPAMEAEVRQCLPTAPIVHLCAPALDGLAVLAHALHALQ